MGLQAWRYTGGLGVLVVWLCGLPLCAADREWTVFPDCRLEPNPANDGDSFHVQCASTQLYVRLYFVDAPETDDRFPDRVAEQAAYFGVSNAVVLRVGKQAERYTRRKLADGFSVYTRYEDARGASAAPRVFAMIDVDGKWLAESLVQRGLARVYGCAVTLPDGTSRNAYWDRLRAAERKAKQKGVGGWKADPAGPEHGNDTARAAATNTPAGQRAPARREKNGRPHHG